MSSPTCEMTKLAVPCHVEEPDPVAQEREHSKFIGSIQDTGKITGFEQCIMGERQVAESFDIGLFEGELARFTKIIAWELVGDAVRKSERILDRQFHIGQSHLRLDAAILKLHHAVNDALGMHQYLDLFRFQVDVDAERFQYIRAAGR